MKFSENLSVCMYQEYCTDCRLRKECELRKSFYDEDFTTNLHQSTDLSNLLASSLGYSVTEVLFSETIFYLQIIKKRECELQIHPVFSVD